MHKMSTWKCLEMKTKGGKILRVVIILFCANVTPATSDWVHYNYRLMIWDTKKYFPIIFSLIRNSQEKFEKIELLYVIRK